MAHFRMSAGRFRSVDDVLLLSAALA